MREDQVTQVRGFADQSLRKQDDPEDDSNRRVSFIVQYLPAPETNSGAAGVSGGRAASGGKAASVAGNRPKPPPADPKNK